MDCIIIPGPYYYLVNGLDNKKSLLLAYSSDRTNDGQSRLILSTTGYGEQRDRLPTCTLYVQTALVQNPLRYPL